MAEEDGSARISGYVKIDGVGASRDVLIVKDDPAGRTVLAEGQSQGDGSFDIEYFGWLGPVIALALDKYGQDWSPETALNAGTVVHPSSPNGYVYHVTVAGTTGFGEPSWTTDGTVQDGGVTYEAKPYYRPIASGPLQGETVVDPDYHRLRFGDNYTPPNGGNVTLRFSE